MKSSSEQCQEVSSDELVLSLYLIVERVIFDNRSALKNNKVRRVGCRGGRFYFAYFGCEWKVESKVVEVLKSQ